MHTNAPSAEGAARFPVTCPDLSVVLITRNEEHNLRRCLDSASFAGEIVVCDSGSTDGTEAVAREYTEHVHRVEWNGFGATKQAALDCATRPWVLSLDADEVIDDVLRREIQNILTEADPSYVGYRVNRLSNFLGTWMRHSGWYPDRVLRLGRRERMRFSPHQVHEHLTVDGPWCDLRGHLLHYTDPTWTHYLGKLTRYSELSAKSLYESGRRARLWDLTVRPLYQFVRTYILKAGFLDGRAGLILAVGSAFHVFSKYARLWNLKRCGGSCTS
jgi:glycosyltransferase involved in cell wall biosynthesis